MDVDPSLNLGFEACQTARSQMINVAFTQDYFPAYIPTKLTGREEFLENILGPDVLVLEVRFTKQNFYCSGFPASKEMIKPLELTID